MNKCVLRKKKTSSSKLTNLRKVKKLKVPWAQKLASHVLLSSSISVYSTVSEKQKSPKKLIVIK